MNYLDVSYILRLYVEDPGWEAVRSLAAEGSVACSLHGHAEVVAALHRKFREGTFSKLVYGQVLDQFRTDCDNGAYRWLPVSPAVIRRVEDAYSGLPPAVFLRASDALHLACAQDNGFRQVYSNDSRLIAAAEYFTLEGVDLLH
jgi:predicted nucleic acid-binding protein